MRKYLSPAVFLAVVCVGLWLTWAVFQAETTAERQRFEAVAREAIDRVSSRIDQQLSVLAATQAFFEAAGGVAGHNEFRTFVLGLELTGQLRGLQGVGFAQLIRTGAEAPVNEALSVHFGPEAAVWPNATAEDWRTPIVMLEPQASRNARAIGYDMFSEPLRRAAMSRAMETGKPHASAPVELVQETGTEKQSGFLVYSPFRGSQPRALGDEPGRHPDGFIYAPVRAGDLILASLTHPQELPVEVEVTDLGADSSTQPVLFRSEDYAQLSEQSFQSMSGEITVAGRGWLVRVRQPDVENGIGAHWRSLLICTFSLLFAAALAVSIRNQNRAVEARRELETLSQQVIAEKDLMLQEMKHRIKNSIARILAIARQTASSSPSLESFSSSFASRLQAMANAQDLLTRSRWQRAGLNELLEQELEQVFGEALQREKLCGPPVVLNEKAAHALSLVFHELATNALKYARVGDEGGALTVDWTLEATPKGKLLQLVWTEKSAQAVEPGTAKGFGTRLIDASIRGELGGKIEREFTGHGLTVRMSVPLQA
ncbi:Blue-light-activated histidine kinase [Pannonibacter phragmitetus]|uniref:histidine kinase n=1 Tax=Pannonibacter phragmitetus TaxID=121719 RepID=A0A378ZPK1_9HYPH|nr:CHASE domain-containing protein [Pannonibacter phragmitetus]SUA99205.1 Blue-light-activated histidine kinase [Pannonibacter phragmitetus]